MQRARGAVRVTLRRGGKLLPLCVAVLLAATPSLATTNPATRGLQQDLQQQQQEQQQMAPLVVPEWWWLSSMLSLPQRHHGHTAITAAGTPSRNGAADIEEAGEGEAATLSLMLPLDELPAGDEAGAAGRVGKRGAVCRGGSKGACRRGAVSTMSGSEVRENWGADYLSIPEALVTFSQHQAEEQVCKDLSVQLFRVDLRKDYLEPVWVRETVHLGVCPSMLQERRLGDHVWPSSVVEVKCLCQRASCSNMGGDFRCQAVRRPVRTWVRHGTQTFMPSQETVSVGCVCVQRTGAEANHVNLLDG